MAVATAGPNANNLHLAPDKHNTSSLNFYRLDALPDTKSTVFKALKTVVTGTEINYELL